MTNSHIVLARSDTAQGPYEYVKELLPVFAHAPHTWRGPDGALYVVHEGRNDTVPVSNQSVCNGDLPRPPPAPHRRRRLQPTNAECTGVMFMRSASGSPFGPWDTRMLYFPNATGATNEWAKVGVDNPALLVLANRTGALLAFRSCSAPEYSGVARSFVARPGADSWWTDRAATPPFTSVTPGPIFQQFNNEDPFLWQDARGHFHAIWHFQDDSCPGCGGHSFSRDGVAWRWSATLAYTHTIEWTDRTTTTMRGRERPGLMLDNATWTVPQYLTSAVTVPGDSGRSYLHIQPIAGHSDK